MSTTTYVDVSEDFDPFESERAKDKAAEASTEKKEDQVVYDKDPVLDRVLNKNQDSWTRPLAQGAERKTRVFIVEAGTNGNAEVDVLKTQFLAKNSKLVVVNEHMIPRKNKGDIMLVIDYIDNTKCKIDDPTPSGLETETPEN